MWLHLTSLYQSVTATFDTLPNALIIGNPKLYRLLQPAYIDSATGAVIQAKGIAFIENLTMETSKDLTIEGGFDPDFSAQNGYTILQGTLTVGLGSIVVDYLTIE
jgi:hypothetical protein